MDGRDPRSSGPGFATGCARIAIPAVALALVALFAVPKLLPDGIAIDSLPVSESSSGPKGYEGLLFVPSEGVGKMTFSGVELLRENDALRSRGRQNSETICVDAGPDLIRRIESELKAVPAEPSGGRPLWARFTAERRFGAWPCLQRPEDAAEGVTQLGLMLRIASIESIRPLGCDGLTFVMNDLRCPEAPRPVVLTDEDGSLHSGAGRSAAATGSVVVRLLADSANAVLSCTAVESSGDPAIDSAACALLRERPDLVAKEGRTEGFATGLREVTQRITWRPPAD